jgi:hypothetical protein
MKKRLIITILILMIFSGCGSSNNLRNCCETSTEAKSGENDPIMKLLASSLIILAINFLATKNN